MLVRRAETAWTWHFLVGIASTWDGVLSFTPILFPAGHT